MTPGSESWFDRLATKRLTRRQGLRAAAMATAATVGAGLPLARSVPAASADADDCRKGCVYTANQAYATRRRDATAGFALTESGAGSFIGVVGPIAVIFSLVASRAQYQQIDGNLAAHRREVANCFKPGCPGFDKSAPGGPCENCVGEFHCNPCAVEEIGYVCCVYPPGDCHGDCCPTTLSPGCP